MTVTAPAVVDATVWSMFTTTPDYFVGVFLMQLILFLPSYKYLFDNMRMVSFVESQWRMFESTRSKRCISDWRIEDIILIRDSFMILLAWI